jgi:hypothetical protein
MKNILRVVVAITLMFSAGNVYSQCTSEISGNSSYCTGSSTTLTATLLTGSGTIDSYQWKKEGVDIPAATNVSYQANEAANYKVTIKTKTPNCTAVSPSFSVSENAIPTTNISGDQSICPGNSSLLNSNAIAGSGTITSFQWKKNSTDISNATDATYSATTAGSYTVIVSNSNNCTTTSSAFDFALITSPSATIMGSISICKGFTTNLTISLTSGTAPWSFIYNDGNNDITIGGINSATYNLNVAPNIATTYTLKSVTDINCTATLVNQIATVIVNERPTASILSADTTICYGSAANISGNVSANGNWNLTLSSGEVISGSENNFSKSVSPLSTTTYTIYSLTDQSCFSLPTDLTENAVVTLKPKLTASITNSSTSICNGEKVFVNGKVTATGNWTLVLSPGGIDTTGNGTMDFSIPVSPNTTTTYSIASLLLNDGSCSALPEDLSGTASVIVNSNLSATITSNDTTICYGDTAYIKGNVFADGPWVLTLSSGGGNAYGSDTGAFSIAVSPLPFTTTIFKISSLDAGSCSALESSLTGDAAITVRKKLSATITTDSTVICNGVSIILSGTVTAPAGTWTLNLSSGDVISGTGNNFSQTVSPSTTTTYYIDSLSLLECSALTTDLKGAPQISVSSTLSASFSSTEDSICYGSAATIIGNVFSDGAWKLYLSPNLLITGLGNTFIESVSPTSSTIYTIDSLVAGDCSALDNDISGSFTVTVNPIPSLNIFDDVTYCNGVLTPIISLGNNDTLYYWVNYNPEILLGDTIGEGDIPVFTTFNSGTTAKNATVAVYPQYNGCIGETKTLKIIVNPTPILNSLNTDTVCNNSTFFYKATSATNVSFSWVRAAVPGINGNLSGSDDYNIINELLLNSTDNPITVTYVFKLITLDGLCENLDSLWVTVNPTPKISGTTDTVICNDFPFTYTATSNTINAGFNWERIAIADILPLLGSGNSEFINETLHNSNANPVVVTYKFNLTTADAMCTNIEELKVTVNPSPKLSSDTIITICNETPFSYTAESNTTSAGLQWERFVVNGISNIAATGNNNINETLNNTTPNPITVPYYFSITTADGLCVNEDTLLLNVNPTPVLSSPKFDTICSDETLYYVATSETIYAGFKWERKAAVGIFPIVNSGNHQEIYESLHNSTNNPVTVLYVFEISTADDLCSNFDTLELIVNPSPAPPVFLSTDTNRFSISLCKHSQNINFFVLNPQVNVIYNWYVLPETGIEIGAIADPNTVISFNNEGTYSVFVTATDTIYNCTATDSQTVIVSSDEVDFGERNIILKQPGNLLVYPYNTLSGYQWGYNTMEINGSDTILGIPNNIHDQVYQVLIPEEKFISNNLLNTNDYAFWVLLTNGNCITTVYYNGPYAHQKTETVLNDGEIEITIFPNPNSGSFNISLFGNIYGNIDAEIFNLLGEKVFKTSFYKTKNETSLQVENLLLANGIYLLQLTDSNHQKLISRINIINR